MSDQEQRPASGDKAEGHATRRRPFFVDAQSVRRFVPTHDLPPFRRRVLCHDDTPGAIRARRCCRAVTVSARRP
jgi:hypothetical protein